MNSLVFWIKYCKHNCGLFYCFQIVTEMTRGEPVKFWSFEASVFYITYAFYTGTIGIIYRISDTNWMKESTWYTDVPMASWCWLGFPTENRNRHSRQLTRHTETQTYTPELTPNSPHHLNSKIEEETTKQGAVDVGRLRRENENRRSCQSIVRWVSCGDPTSYCKL